MSNTTLCHKAGCFRTAEPGKHFCSRHLYLEESYNKRPVPVRKKSSEWHNLYNSQRWRTVSKEFLAGHPYCYICGEKATIVDHIRPHRGDVELFFDETNLQPMCWKHHSAKTLKENNYFKPDRGSQKHETF